MDKNDWLPPFTKCRLLLKASSSWTRPFPLPCWEDLQSTDLCLQDSLVFFPAPTPRCGQNIRLQAPSSSTLPSPGHNKLRKSLTITIWPQSQGWILAQSPWVSAEMSIAPDVFLPSQNYNEVTKLLPRPHGDSHRPNNLPSDSHKTAEWSTELRCSRKPTGREVRPETGLATPLSPKEFKGQGCNFFIFFTCKLPVLQEWLGIQQQVEGVP